MSSHEAASHNKQSVNDKMSPIWSATCVSSAAARNCRWRLKFNSRVVIALKLSTCTSFDSWDDALPNFFWVQTHRSDRLGVSFGDSFVNLSARWKKFDNRLPWMLTPSTCTPFDSWDDALSTIFWVGSDRTKRSDVGPSDSFVILQLNDSNRFNHERYQFGQQRGRPHSRKCRFWVWNGFFFPNWNFPRRRGPHSSSSHRWKPRQRRAVIGVKWRQSAPGWWPPPLPHRELLLRHIVDDFHFAAAQWQKNKRRKKSDGKYCGCGNFYQSFGKWGTNATHPAPLTGR